MHEMGININKLVWSSKRSKEQAKIKVDNFFPPGLNSVGAVLSRVEIVQELWSHSGYAYGRLFHPGPVHLRAIQIYGERQSKLQ